MRVCSKSDEIFSFVRDLWEFENAPRLLFFGDSWKPTTGVGIGGKIYSMYTYVDGYFVRNIRMAFSIILSWVLIN